MNEHDTAGFVADLSLALAREGMDLEQFVYIVAASTVATESN